MLSYNEDALRQEEINFKSCPPHSRLPLPAGSRAAGCPAARDAPLQGDNVCKPLQPGTLRGGLLSLLYRGAKPVLATAGLTLPREQWGTWCALAPHTPHPLLPLLLHTPSGPRGAPRSPVALSQTKQLHWPSHRHWGRCKITNRFSSPGLGAGSRDGGAGAHGAGSWWVCMARPHSAPSPDHHLHPRKEPQPHRAQCRCTTHGVPSIARNSESGTEDATAPASAFKGLSFHKQK